MWRERLGTGAGAFIGTVRQRCFGTRVVMAGSGARSTQMPVGNRARSKPDNAVVEGEKIRDE
ncbi:hypothetical protein IMZ48_24435 [Candidatus Bathyarchaeota archaeon]|nr:hypothetical protein [Candidatus Bathyarchaeota archaeon]